MRMGKKRVESVRQDIAKLEAFRNGDASSTSPVELPPIAGNRSPSRAGAYRPDDCCGIGAAHIVRAV